MVSLTGGDFILGFLAGTLLGGFVIGIAKDVVGGIINMASGAISGPAQVGVVGYGYSGRESEDSWT